MSITQGKLTKQQIGDLRKAMSLIRTSQEAIATNDTKLYALHDDAMSYIDDIIEDYKPS